MVPSCWGVFASALSLVFPKPCISPCPHFLQAWGDSSHPSSRDGAQLIWQRVSQKPEEPLTEGISLAATGVLMGVAQPKHQCSIYIWFFQALQWSCPRQSWACHQSLPHSCLGCALPGTHHLPPSRNNLDWTVWDPVAEEVFHAHSEFLLIWINNC